MSYDYDVFLSYPHEDPVFTWVREYFKPALNDWLGQAMSERPRIFRDEECLRTGATWPLALREALLRSKIVVAIWSNSYYRSPACCAELDSILQRERQLGLRASRGHQGLVYPILFYGDPPGELEDIQYQNFRSWNHTSPGFKRTERFVEFEIAMQKVAEDLAALIKVAPVWRDSFPITLPETATGFREIPFKIPRL